MTENQKQQMNSIREQVQQEIVALNESGKTPTELATAMLEKLVEARYRMLQLHEINRKLTSFLGRHN
jgi:hypothetical protein